MYYKRREVRREPLQHTPPQLEGSSIHQVLWRERANIKLPQRKFTVLVDGIFRGDTGLFARIGLEGGCAWMFFHHGIREELLSYDNDWMQSTVSLAVSSYECGAVLTVLTVRDVSLLNPHRPYVKIFTGGSQPEGEIFPVSGTRGCIKICERPSKHEAAPS